MSIYNNNNKYIIYNNKYIIYNNKYIIYNNKYIILINPNNINNINNINNKIYIKQSYILIAWINYITKKKVKSFILPRKKYKFTLLKTPMAHKTYSQEQYKFQYYKLIIPFKVNLMKCIKHKHNITNIILQTRKFLYKNNISTNLFLNKETNVKYLFNEKEYFKI